MIYRVCLLYGGKDGSKVVSKSVRDVLCKGKEMISCRDIEEMGGKQCSRALDSMLYCFDFGKRGEVF
jgi:hypothetical protein